MKTERFEKQRYTYEDIVEAVQYGVNYGLEDQEQLKVPEGNIQQWLEFTKKRTSDKWQELFPDIVVIDPDGWDRTDFKRTWYEEEISYQEYMHRRDQSTCMFNKKQVEK